MRKSFYAFLIMIFVGGISYGQTGQPQLEAKNTALDKIEQAIRDEFGPRVLSLSKDYQKSRLVVRLSPEPRRTIVAPQQSFAPFGGTTGFGSTGGFGPTSGSAPPPAPSTIDRVTNTVDRATSGLPTPTVESTRGGYIVGGKWKW